MSDYLPTVGMISELALTELRERSLDGFSRERCIRRGLISHRGLTEAGQDALRRATLKHELHHG